MTATEALSLGISLFSLLVAGAAAYRTYALSRLQLHLASRHEFQKLLLDVDKELLRDPELWGVYDNHAMHSLAEQKRDDPHHQAKLEAFAYMFLNIFEIVNAFTEDWGKRDAAAEGFFKSLHGTCKDFYSNSELARKLLSKENATSIFDPRFMAYIESMKKELASCSSSNPDNLTTLPSRPG